jgi:hypothetical protein
MFTGSAVRSGVFSLAEGRFEHIAGTLSCRYNEFPGLERDLESLDRSSGKGLIWPDEAMI